MKKRICRGALLAAFRYVLLAAILVGAVGAVPLVTARSTGSAGALPFAPERHTGATGEILLDGEG